MVSKKVKPGRKGALWIKEQTTTLYGEKIRPKYRNISLLALKTATSQIDNAHSVSAALNIATNQMNLIKSWINSYEERNGRDMGRYMFKEHWKVLRHWVSLQTRLAIEQVLWERGGFYRQLVSGFRPLD